VNKSESRLEAKILELENRQNQRMEKSYMSISKSVSDFGNDLKRLALIIQDNYSKREIDKNNKDMEDQLNRIEKMIAETHKKTEDNEIDFSKLDTKINTALIVLGITIPFIISLTTWIFLNELRNIKESIALTKQQIEATLPERVKPILEGYEFQVTNTKDNI
jgi:hypothetical protein